eukprot:1003180-Amphidinium_carterae.1
MLLYVHMRPAVSWCSVQILVLGLARQTEAVTAPRYAKQLRMYLSCCCLPQSNSKQLKVLGSRWQRAQRNQSNDHI